MSILHLKEVLPALLGDGHDDIDREIHRFLLSMQSKPSQLCVDGQRLVPRPSNCPGNILGHIAPMPATRPGSVRTPFCASSSPAGS